MNGYICPHTMGPGLLVLGLCKAQVVRNPEGTTTVAHSFWPTGQKADIIFMSIFIYININRFCYAYQGVFLKDCSGGKALP